MTHRSGSRRGGALLVMVATAINSPASAITPLDGIGVMAADAAAIHGAAAACGIDPGRLAAMADAAFRRIEATGASAHDMKRARSIFSYMAERATERVRADPASCPEAVRSFEDAERRR